MGRPTRRPYVTNFSLRSRAAFDFGPGGTTTTLGPVSPFLAATFLADFFAERFAMVS